MTALTGLVRSFAALLAPHKDNPERLTEWITTAREADLPHMHSFARGIHQDTDAVTAAITLEHHNGRTEGVNTKTKLLKRQMHGRAASHSYATASSSDEHSTSPPKGRQSRY